MKTIRTIAASTILLVIAALSVCAQGTTPATTPRPAATPATNPAPADVPVPVSKVAFVDTEAFGDERAGIARFVTALKTLQREFKPKQDEMLAAQAKIRQLATEIDTLSKSSVVDPKSIQAKQDEVGRIEREIKYKKEDYDAATAKRYRELVGPVSADIGKELDNFAALRGITLLLDISKLLPAVLTAKGDTDVTKAFIAYYNAKNPATAAAPAPK